MEPPNLEPVTCSGERPARQEEEHSQDDEQQVNHIGTFGSASFGVSASVFNYVLDLCKEVIRESVRNYTAKIFRRQAGRLRRSPGQTPSSAVCYSDGCPTLSATHRGRSSVGLERRPVTSEVAGSSPVVPAILFFVFSKTSTDSALARPNIC